jgi:hypothetical protein
MMEALGALEALSSRFHGVDLQCRNSGTDWPARWRAACVATKNERTDYRLACYGDTAEAAAAALLDAIDKVSRESSKP